MRSRTSIYKTLQSQLQLVFVFPVWLIFNSLLLSLVNCLEAVIRKLIIGLTRFRLSIYECFSLFLLVLECRLFALAMKIFDFFSLLSSYRSPPYFPFCRRLQLLPVYSKLKRSLIQSIRKFHCVSKYQFGLICVLGLSKASK